MSKQTAVEWLVEQLECFGNKHELQMSWATVDELVEQAKAMEREQIVNAHLTGLIYSLDMPASEQSVQYYNETYKGGEQ